MNVAETMKALHEMERIVYNASPAQQDAWETDNGSLSEHLDSLWDEAAERGWKAIARRFEAMFNHVTGR